MKPTFEEMVNHFNNLIDCHEPYKSFTQKQFFQEEWENYLQSKEWTSQEFDKLLQEDLHENFHD